MSLELEAPDMQVPGLRLQRARWGMVSFAFAATVINYLDRQTLSVVAPELREEFGMSNEDYGYVLAAFMLAYTVSNGLSGPLLDRIGTRVGYALCMAWWSTAGILHAFATGPWTLAGFRFLLGVGEAGNWPAGAKLVSEWFPPRERALAAGIFNSGAAIGAIIAPPLVTWLVLTWNWQTAFVIVGLSGYVWLAAWSLMYYTPASASLAGKTPTIQPWRLLRTRFLAVLTLSKVFLDPVWYFYIFWFPQYLKSVRGFDLAEIGMTAWIPFVTADLGNIVGGWLTGQLIQRGMPTSQARKAVFGMCALLMTSAIPAVFTENSWISVALISVATFGYTGCNSNAIAFPPDVVPKSLVASVWGLASMGSGFGGMVFSWLSGRVIDQYGYGPVFIAYGIMPLIAAALVLLVMGPLKPLSELQETSS